MSLSILCLERGAWQLHGIGYVNCPNTRLHCVADAFAKFVGKTVSFIFFNANPFKHAKQL